MVVDQRTLKANMLRSSIGSNVRNKLTGQQAQTQQTTPTVQQTTDTPITQSRGLQQTTQQQPEVYKVITNKFPTYDVKDIMGFGPQAVKNQLGFANTVSQYNRLQAQADANTDPNVRYNLTKPELTNKQTLQIQQATPETNEQGLKINKTNSFKDLVIDLKNGADQGGSLSFMKFRDLYPEYVENWDEVLDLYESIKANPSYTTEQITQNAQKQYPELFGINDNYSDSDKMSALKRLYDEMVSNKQNGIQLTQQDIIDKYPEYANTEDINTVMELQDFINKDKKSTPTFIDVYDISDQFKSLTKGNTEYGNAEKEQISNDLKSLDKIDANIYNYLSEEGQDYVKTLALAKEIGDMVRKDYRVPDNISDYDLLMKVKDEMPEVYSELTKGVNVTNELSDYDRKIFEGKTTGKKFAQQSIKKIGGNLMAVLGPDAVKGLGILTNRLGDLVESGYTGISNKLENATGNRGIFENTEGISEGSHALGDTLIRASGWLKEDLESQDRYQEFLQEQGAEKAKGAGINFKGYKNALKEGDMKGIRDTFVKDVNEAKDLGWGTWLSKNLGSLGYLLPSMFAGTKAEMFLSFLPSGVGRAYEDYANDEGIKANLTDKQIQDRAILAGGLESLIEVMETPFRKGKRGSFMENFPGMRNAIVRTIMMTEKGAVGEGLEEVAQEFSNRLIAKASGSERDLGTLDEYLDIFAETVSSSQIVSLLGGSAEGIDQQKLNNLEQQIAEDTEYRNKILEGQAFVANDFNEFANAVEVVPGTTTEELQQVWNNAQQKKQDLEKQSEAIASNSYNNVNVPTYERTTVKENEQPKLSAKDSQEYTDLLDEMEKNGEITKEDRKKVEMSLGVFTRNTEKTEQPQTEGLAEVAETPKTEKKTGWWTRKMSGLDNETITRIENNPYISSYWNNAVNMVEKEGLSMDNGKIIEQPMQELGEELLKRIEKAEKDLGEDGRMYRLIKDIKETYDLSDSRKGIEGVLKNYDITTNEDGKLDFSNSQFIKAEDTNAISRAVELLNNTDLTNITPKQYWNLRKKLSSLSGFDKGTSKDGEAVVRQLRHLVDQLAKDNIPGLKKVDEIFSKELKYLEEIKQGLVYQQGERKGQIKDNFYSILKTINNQNRQQMNQRLEKIMPDLSDKVEAINMLPKLLKAYAVKSRLIEVGARNIGKVGGAVTGGIPGLVVGYVFDEITRKVSKNLRKNAINKIVNNMSDTAKQRLEDIAAKQEEKETLTQEERETLNQVKAEIEKIIEQENNEQKPQSQSETEKKSEKKTNKVEQVQAKKKNNQNQKPKTKGLAKIDETKEETKTEGLVKIDETKSQSESKIDNRVQEQPLFNVETKQEGLAAISVKVENGKVVKESEVEQESETVETPQEFEVLPADVRVADEEKQIGSKRIAPDRVPRQQTTYQGGVDKVYEKVKTIAEYMRVTDKYYSKDGHRDQNIAERFKKLRTDVQNILYGNEGFRFASDKSKEFKELWKNISDNKMLVAPLKEIAKNFYISRVKKDISKGYVYPQEVLEQIPGAEKAVNARQRYEKGLDTSFSAKDNRIDYSEKDVIGAGIKSQDGKQVTNEQKQDIVKGILDFGKTMGLDMKKFAEDRGLVYVHLHGGSPFLSTFGGMYREATSEQGDKNISVSVGGAENIRYKDKKTKERKTETLNTTMSHELGHAMDYLVDKRLLSWEQKSILRTKFNPVNRLYDYYSRPTEITARAIEQYVAIENGQADYYEENGNLDAGEFKGTDMEYYLKEIGSYYERPGYWNKSDYENYVKPYVEEAFKNNFNEYKTDTIGGKDINQIKQEAVQRGLAEINNF